MNAERPLTWFPGRLNNAKLVAFTNQLLDFGKALYEGGASLAKAKGPVINKVQSDAAFNVDVKSGIDI
jgi:hypothetical protein